MKEYITSLWILLLVLIGGYFIINELSVLKDTQVYEVEAVNYNGYLPVNFENGLNDYPYNEATNTMNDQYYLFMDNTSYSFVAYQVLLSEKLNYPMFMTLYYEDNNGDANWSGMFVNISITMNATLGDLNLNIIDIEGLNHTYNMEECDQYLYMELTFYGYSNYEYLEGYED